MLATALAVAVFAAPAWAERARDDSYQPAVWVDPDGCRHWVMDDGLRGYMDPVRDAKGRPVCEPGARPGRTAFPPTEDAEAYVPAVWIDPDGCRHWAMDDGQRGFMDIVLDRQGRPVCNPAEAALSCATLTTDQLFATGSAAITGAARARLVRFFAADEVSAYQIAGHTDARGSDAANLALGRARAQAVAAVAKAAGAKVLNVASFGERQPRATNRTAAGRAENRRVEISCVE
jgi:outer membrane protein OmpA-like peptidoglycan-associated protein